MRTTFENGYTVEAKSDTPLYMQIYMYYKSLIQDGKLAPNTKLPSIRRCADSFSISRTTAEAAYFQLCADGYVLSKPQSGYYVTDLYFQKAEKKPSQVLEEKAKIRYNFSALSADRESFDFQLWRRYLKSALRQDERLLSYGEVQGEEDLREAIAQYIGEKRNVVCSAENIVIGAGVQSLLHILCAMLPKESVYFQDDTFIEGMAVFKDHGFVFAEKQADARYIYTSPSHRNRLGDVMPAKERIALLKTASKQNALLIEDDYDNEFGYFEKAAPALQGLDGGRRVVYIGTFSKLLLPSIRLSFMVLPDALLPRYRTIASSYNQTASKTEQIALCQFIRDGRLSGQIRKARRLYAQKAVKLEQAILETFQEKAKTKIGDTGFILEAEIQTDEPAKNLYKRAKENGILLRDAKQGAGCVSLWLSCSGLHVPMFKEAIEALYEICYPDKL